MEAHSLYEEKLFSAGVDEFSKTLVFLSNHEAAALGHSEVEEELSSRLREVGRLLMEEHIRSRGCGKIAGGLVGSDGILRRQERPSSRNLMSIFGKVKVDRITYSANGKGGLSPKDADLKLANGSYSYALRKRAAMLIAENSFESSQSTLEKIVGVKVPKRQLEEIAETAARDFDAFYIASSKEAPKPSDLPPLQVLTTDGKGIVMRQEDLREATRQKAENSSSKLKTRQSRGEKKNAKRMAQVASVYDIDRFKRSSDEIMNERARIKLVKNRPKPGRKRVWASIEKIADTVIEDMFLEAIRRDHNKEREWVVLVDGHRNQMHNIEAAIAKHNPKATIVVDIIHVIEYLWKAARVFYTETDPEGEKWVCEKLKAVLDGRASSAAAGMRRSATLAELDDSVRKPVDDCAKYLLRKKAYLNYPDYLSRGYPIGTGIIEGACRHLIKDRMDITGARWSLTGSESVLKLRSLAKSHDFESYWEFHLAQEFKRNHQDKYWNVEHVLKKLG